jgi:hypothetical protein
MHFRGAAIVAGDEAEQDLREKAPLLRPEPAHDAEVDRDQLAGIVDQIDASTRDGLVLAPETVAALAHTEARRNRASTVALWVIALSLAVLAIGVLR